MIFEYFYKKFRVRVDWNKLINPQDIGGSRTRAIS